MTTIPTRRRLHGAALAILGCIFLASCAAHSSTGSRVELFESVESLAEASVAVVRVSVSGQRFVSADEAARTQQSAHTISDVSVLESWVGARLGARHAAHPEIAAGDRITVRQGGTESEPSHGELLRVGQEYVLFLTPTEISDAPADQFYVTGGMAGIYVAEGSDAEFRRMFDEGDTLPGTLRAAELSAVVE